MCQMMCVVECLVIDETGISIYIFLQVKIQFETDCSILQALDAFLYE